MSYGQRQKRKVRADYKCMAVASFIVVYATNHGGNSPTVQEIADHFGVAVNAITYHLTRLQELKLADRIDGKLVLSGVVYVPPEWYIPQVVD